MKLDLAHPQGLRTRRKQFSPIYNNILTTQKGRNDCNMRDPGVTRNSRSHAQVKFFILASRVAASKYQCCFNNIEICHELSNGCDVRSLVYQLPSKLKQTSSGQLGRGDPSEWLEGLAAFQVSSGGRKGEPGSFSELRGVGMIPISRGAAATASVSLAARRQAAQAHHWQPGRGPLTPIRNPLTPSSARSCTTFSRSRRSAASSPPQLQASTFVPNSFQSRRNMRLPPSEHCEQAAGPGRQRPPPPRRAAARHLQPDSK